MKKFQKIIKREIWAIILAAGESKRMNSPKLLLPYKGRTMIEAVIENVLASDIENIMIVLGSSGDAILDTIKNLDIKHCYNSNYKDGMLSSVKFGFRSIPDSFHAAVVFQGDQPMIPSCVINELISAWKMSGKGIIIPVFNKKRGHPILIDRKYKHEIEKLEINMSLNTVSGRFREDVFEVEVESPDILRDIDTEEDYLKELNQTG
jgi:molybdenum cofactor cytidylyltransferase